MASDGIDDDHYVAELLKQDAKNTAKNYEMVGLDAFVSKRPRPTAPKPNTTFLRHIIRQTDSHNAALLAKEAEESRARLRQMDREKQGAKGRAGDRKGRGSGRLTPPDLTDEEPRHQKRRREDDRDDDNEADRRHSRKHRRHSRESKSRRDRDEGRNRWIDRRKHEDSDDEHYQRRSRHSKPEKERRRKHSSGEDGDSDDEWRRGSYVKHHGERRHRHGSDGDEDRSRRKDRRQEHRSSKERSHSRRKEDTSEKHRRQRSRSRSTSGSRSPSPRRRRHHETSKRGYSPHSLRSPKRRTSRHSKSTNEQQRLKQPSPPPDSDSDPLEAIVGPLPPPSQPTVRPRGRGAHKANSTTMDARFSFTYDPTTDVQLNSDAEDEWGDALEALRDRQKWKQQGAERLKGAGFSDQQIKKWENGDEKTDEDVVWAMKGQAREWDRGKVVDEDGDVDLKADWGRLK